MNVSTIRTLCLAAIPALFALVACEGEDGGASHGDPGSLASQERLSGANAELASIEDRANHSIVSRNDADLSSSRCFRSYETCRHVEGADLEACRATLRSCLPTVPPTVFSLCYPEADGGTPQLDGRPCDPPDISTDLFHACAEGALAPAVGEDERETAHRICLSNIYYDLVERMCARVPELCKQGDADREVCESVSSRCKGLMFFGRDRF